MHNAYTFLNAYDLVFNAGIDIYPRGLHCKNIRNAVLPFSLADNPCSTFEDRKFNLQYARKELLWYIEGDAKADWICEYATMWQKLRQPDDVFFSNYGQYIFPNQIKYVIEALKQDIDTRRAVMVLLQPYHIFHENIDMVCTYAMHFCIEQDMLHMTVHMRSNDLIYGTSNDAFCFWYIARIVYEILKAEAYPNLRLGTYTHTANSLHIYERHFQMVEQILAKDWMAYKPVHIEVPTYAAARAIVDRDFTVTSNFMEWLRA